MKRHHIALLPGTGNGVVAIGGNAAIGIERTALGIGDCHIVLGLLPIDETIKVAGHHIALHPPGYANLERKQSCRILVDADIDLVAVGIGGLLL